MLSEKYKHLQRKVEQWLVCCNATENFIFSLKCRQWKVDLNTSKKSLVFVTIWHRKFHLYVQLSYTKISYLRKNTHYRKDAAFSHFQLKESSENMIFPWNWNAQKQTKIWSFLHFSQIFVIRKFFFSCSAVKRHILNTNCDNLPSFSFQICSKSSEHVHILCH